MNPTETAQSTTRSPKVKRLLVAVALVAAVLVGMALGDPANAREASEAATSWAPSYFGWSWLY